MSNAAQAQGMVTNVTYVQNQNPNTVLNNIHTLADHHSKAGVRLCCGIAQFMIVRAYHQTDEERWSADRSRDYLKIKLNEHGLKTAMIYRYIQTGHKLALAIVRRYALGGIVHDILTADNENKAFAIIERCVTNHGFLPSGQAKPVRDWSRDAEHKPRFSMDVLRINLGLETIPEPAKPPMVDANNPAAALGDTSTSATTGTAPEAAEPATKAKPRAIVQRLREDLKGDKTVLRSIPEDVIVGAAAIHGKERVAERLVATMNLNEIMALQAAITARMAELSGTAKVDTTTNTTETTEEPAPVNTEAANDPEPAKPAVERPARRRAGKR